MKKGVVPKYPLSFISLILFGGLNMIKYGIIGAGWRSEFYLRIASLIPEKFSVSGIYVRNSEKKKNFQKNIMFRFSTI